MLTHVIPLVPKRTLDFGNTPGTQEVILADMVDVLHWRELTLVVKVHSHSLAGGAGTIDIVAQPQSWTEEDPGVPFISKSGEFGVAIHSSIPSPAFLSTDIDTFGSAAMTAMARIIARANRVGPGALTATVSVEFSVKDA